MPVADPYSAPCSLACRPEYADPSCLNVFFNAVLFHPPCTVHVIKGVNKIFTPTSVDFAGAMHITGRQTMPWPAGYPVLFLL